MNAIKLRKKIIQHEPRVMDLVGCDEIGGNRAYWTRDAKIIPLDRLRRDRDGWIKSGHYVIEWRGHVVVVHLSNYASRKIGIQFMRGALNSVPISIREINAKVLGMVAPDPEHEARTIAALQRLGAAFQAGQEPAP